MKPPPLVSHRPLLKGTEALDRFRPLFHPQGIIVVGVSRHPGKFGFAVFHHLLRFAYQGDVFPVTRDGGEILGQQTYTDVGEVPRNRADLVFLCTPSAVNAPLLRSCQEAGVRAAFVASGGYGEIGAEGEARERELTETADDLGLVLAGPNGQGLVSTSVSMCAQIAPPYPPRGRIAIVSQSGNVCSSLMNYAISTGVGVSKSISCGNGAQTSVADYVAYFAADPQTSVTIVYLEGTSDGRRLVEAARLHTGKKPLVVLKGGVASEGQRAALSHTGALATDDRVFNGLCRQLGMVRAPTVEHAFEWAATFATQTLPRGRRVAILTQAGGWGVLAADACVAAGLEVPRLPEDVRARIDGMLPARWSRNNPLDLAGGETRDTIPDVIDVLVEHSQFDALLYVGLGIQASQAHAFRSGEFYPGFGLDRIVEFHERQDQRYAKAIQELSGRYDKPVLVSSELVHTDHSYGNSGPGAMRQGGRICHASAHRAVQALRALVDYAEFRRSF